MCLTLFSTPVNIERLRLSQFETSIVLSHKTGLLRVNKNKIMAKLTFQESVVILQNVRKKIVYF